MARIWSFCLLWLVLCLPGLGSQSPPVAAPQPAPSRLDQAKQYISQGKLQDALTLLKSLAISAPGTPDLFHQLGLAYYKSGDMAHADEAFARAIKQNPDDRESIQLRGLALYRLGHPAEAIPLLEKVRTWLPATGSDVSYVLGLCYVDAARYDDARRSFAAQYGIDPESAGAYLIAGNLLLRAHLTPPAEAAGHKAEQLAPHLPLVHLLLGEIALSRGDTARAVQEFTAERDVNPGEARVYDRLGDAYYRQELYDQARSALNQAIILDPLSTGPYLQLGRLSLHQKDPALALMYLRRAEKMDPGNYMTHALLGQALRALGQTEEAGRESRVAESLQDAAQPKLENVH